MSKNTGSFSSLMLIICIIIGIIVVIIPQVLIVVGIVLVIFLLKHIFSLLKFYNRKNCINKIGFSLYINANLTRDILSRKRLVKLGRNDQDFNNIRGFYEKTVLSKDVKFKNKKIKVDNISRYPFLKYNITCTCKPIAIRFTYNAKRGIVFYVFPEIILAFAEGPEAMVFIGAYDLKIFNLQYRPIVYAVQTVVYEKSKNSIEYYHKYNPVPDAQIVFCDWTVKNLDGSRSFKGGLLPENNPLKFELRYAQIAYNLGDLYANVEYSNHNTAKSFVEECKKHVCKRQTK